MSDGGGTSVSTLVQPFWVVLSTVYVVGGEGAAGAAWCGGVIEMSDVEECGAE